MYEVRLGQTEDYRPGDQLCSNSYQWKEVCYDSEYNHVDFTL